MKFFPTCMILMPALYLTSGAIAGGHGPYIDSLGYRAAQSRLDAVDAKSPDSLINQALRVQNKRHADPATQPDFFKSIEDNYQRYLKLFTLHKRGQVSEVYCAFDLLETFELALFDPQPFLNAIMHTLSMTDISTLSYDVISKSPDGIIVRVSWSKAVSQEGGKGFAITEGTSDIKVTGHWISAAPAR
jgi:hypothetical protein